jgi:hypothetical protein
MVGTMSTLPTDVMNGYKWELYDLTKDSGQRSCRRQSHQAQRNAGAVHDGGGEVPGLPPRQLTRHLKVDGKVVATQTMERTIPLTLQWDESLDIGADAGTPLDDRDYKVPFRFTGKLNKVTIRVQPHTLTLAEEKLLMQEGGRSNRTSE